jgi:hypothetical protein
VASLCLDQTVSDLFTLYHGDACEVLQGIPDESIGMSVFSPPFAGLYVYSDSERDMGNSADYDEFGEHYRFLAKQLHRVIKPGRIVAAHCFQIPLMKERDGVIGLRDFRGDLIRWMQGEGFIYHSEVCIWKDPVTQMQRTKALGLLHKQVVKDSAMSRQGLADYVVVFRKPGQNPEPIAGGFTEYHGEGTFVSEKNYSIDVWQRYASPVWDDIDPSDTLNFRMAKDENDGRHICPLQLGVIRRCVQLWSNPGDVVLTPYGGIGSEGVVAVEMGRRAVVVELKDSYYQTAKKHLTEAEKKMQAPSLFDLETV